MGAGRAAEPETINLKYNVDVQQRNQRRKRGRRRGKEKGQERKKERLHEGRKAK